MLKPALDAALLMPESMKLLAKELLLEELVLLFEEPYELLFEDP